MGKISIIFLLAILLSGCTWFNRPELQTYPVTQIQAVAIPDDFFRRCPLWVNPPLSVTEGEDTITAQIELGNWIRIIEFRFNECSNSITAIKEEQEVIIRNVEEINRRIRASQP